MTGYREVEGQLLLSLGFNVVPVNVGFQSLEAATDATDRPSVIVERDGHRRAVNASSAAKRAPRDRLQSAILDYSSGHTFVREPYIIKIRLIK